MKTIIILLILFFASLFLLVIPLSLADDLNSIDRLPYIYESAVPKISSLNSNSFTYTDIYSGSMIYSYDIKVPLGTNNLAPSIKFIYNSHDTLSNPSFLGESWRISENYIKRNVNHTITNLNDDYFQLILDGSSYDLVYVPSENRFHTKIENFFYIESKTNAPNTNGQYWLLKTRDGTNYRFGFNTDSESLANQYNFVTKWYLDLVNDTYNNSIFYKYSENPYSPNDIGATYLMNITYNNDQLRRINFIYDNLDRSDLRYIYDNGNKLQESRRLSKINITANDNLINLYIINYINFNYNTKSAISNITIYGSDSNTTLPQVIFNYYLTNPSNVWNNQSNYLVPECTPSQEKGCFSDSSNGDGGVRFADVNADGLLDLIRAGRYYSDSKVWINNGTEWKSNDTWVVPECSSSTGTDMCFTDISYLDNGVRIEDINNDGLPDLVRGNGKSSPYTRIYTNNGHGWVLNASWNLPDCISSNDHGCFIRTNEDTGVRFADVNGDGLPDLVRGNERRSPYNKIWINNGTGWKEDINWKLPECSSSDSTGCFVSSPRGNDTGVRLVDLNNDGLVDLIRGNQLTNPHTKAWINNGTGWVVDSNWGLPSSQTYFLNSDEKDQGSRMADVNGDGLIDLFNANMRTGWNYVWINTGNGWINDDLWKTPSCSGSGGYSCFITENNKDNGLRFADLNGDGVVDLIRGNGYEQATVATWINNATKQYLLANITNEFGGITTINYAPSTTYALGVNASCYNQQSILPFNVWLVANKTNIVQYPMLSYEITKYIYSGGSYSYADKEFRGFCYTKQIRADNSTIQHWFYQDKIRQGKEVMIEIYSNLNSLFKRNQNVFDTKIINNYFIPLLNSSSQINFDGQPAGNRTINITYNYDKFGNNVLIYYFTDSGNYYEGYEYLNNSLLWVVNKPNYHYVMDYSNASKLRESWYKYDNLNYNEAPTKGSLTQVINKQNSTNNVTIGYNYTSNGNLANTTDANGYITQNIYGLRDLTNTFIDRIINANNHVTDYTYDLGTGNLLNKTDSNKNTFHYVYDPLGRIIQEIYPYDSMQYPTKNYSYNMNNKPISIKLSIRETTGSANTLDTYSFYDEFNRIIQSKSAPKEPIQNGLLQLEQSLGSSNSAGINFFLFQDIAPYSLVNFTANGNYNLSTLSMYVSGTHDGDSPTFYIAIHNVNSTGGVGSQVGQNSSEIYVVHNQFGFYNVTWTKGNEPNLISGNNYWIIWENTSYYGGHYFRLGETVGSYHIWYTLSSNDLKGIPQHSLDPMNNVTTLNIKLWKGFNTTSEEESIFDNNTQIAEDIYYDNIGRIKQKSNPYLVAATESYTSANQTVKYINYSYDALDRIIIVINPDGTKKITDYKPTYITKYDENNFSKLYIMDAYNRIVAVQEFIDNNTYYTTSYYYNSLGEMRYLLDSKINNVNFFYDNLGKQIKLEDPDLGTWTYHYDNNRNLILQKDNKNNIIILSYDKLNRIVSKNSSTENITYVYDKELNGTLYKTSNNLLESTFTYDNRLRKIGELKNIDLVKFVTNWTYDSMNRIISIKQPNGEIINYTHNNQGLLKSISSTYDVLGANPFHAVIPSIDYNENAKISSRTYNNSLETIYIYNNSNLRLTNLQTNGKQNLNYLYDKSGNIIKIIDSINSRTETMIYDNLDRLISSEKLVNSDVIFNYTYSYNSIGNIINSTNNGINKNYIYGTYPVHAPISIVEVTN